MLSFEIVNIPINGQLLLGSIFSVLLDFQVAARGVTFRFHVHRVRVATMSILTTRHLFGVQEQIRLICPFGWGITTPTLCKAIAQQLWQPKEKWGTPWRCRI